MNKNRHVQYVHQKRCLRANSWISSGCSLRRRGCLPADNPPVDVACPCGEVDTDQDEFAGICGERRSVLPVLNLLQGVFGRAFELELHDVNEPVGLEHRVNAAFISKLVADFLTGV